MRPHAALPQFAKESDDKGHFVRQESRFREWVGERPEPGHYHLYVSLACPWASRTVIVRQLMGLEDVVPAHAVGSKRPPARLSPEWLAEPPSGSTETSTAS